VWIFLYGGFKDKIEVYSTSYQGTEASNSKALAMNPSMLFDEVICAGPRTCKEVLM
jgi:hypothetical protein